MSRLINQVAGDYFALGFIILATF